MRAEDGVSRFVLGSVRAVSRRESEPERVFLAPGLLALLQVGNAFFKLTGVQQKGSQMREDCGPEPRCFQSNGGG